MPGVTTRQAGKTGSDNLAKVPRLAEPLQEATRPVLRAGTRQKGAAASGALKGDERTPQEERALPRKLGSPSACRRRALPFSPQPELGKEKESSEAGEEKGRGWRGLPFLAGARGRAPPRQPA